MARDIGQRKPIDMIPYNLMFFKKIKQAETL
jgi:hypothetical protein